MDERKITKLMIESGIDSGNIAIVDSDGEYGCRGICCRIGQSEFYFAGSEVENMTLKEYNDSFSKQTTVNMIYNTIKDELTAYNNGIYESEWNFYYSILCLVGGK